MTFCYSSLNRLKQHLNPQKRKKREKKRKGHREEKAIGTGLLNKNLSSQKKKAAERTCLHPVIPTEPCVLGKKT